MYNGGYPGMPDRGHGDSGHRHERRPRREYRERDRRHGRGGRDGRDGGDGGYLQAPGPPPGPPPTAVPYGASRMDSMVPHVQYGQDGVALSGGTASGGAGASGGPAVGGGIERVGVQSQDAQFAGSDHMTNLKRHLDEQDVASITKVLMKLAKSDVRLRNDVKLRDIFAGVTNLLLLPEPPVTPKDLADLAFALGKLQLQDATVMELLAKIGESAKLRVEEFSPHDMSSIVWGFASLGVRNEGLMSVIAAEIVNKIQGFDQRQLANAAWAYAKCGLWNDQLVNSIATECFEKISTFTAQSLSHISWAMAQWVTRKDELMEAIASETQRKIADFAPSSVAMTAWSFASLQIKNIPLMTAISHQAVGKIIHFKTQDLAHLAWAFANVRVQDVDLFNAMSVEIRKNIKGTFPPELSNIAWAFSKNSLADESLMNAISDEAVLQIRHFKSAEIAMLTWAFAVAGLQNKPLMTEVGHQVAKRIDKFSSPQLSHIAWAFGALALRHSEFLSALSTHVQHNVDTFRGQSLANIAWAFAMVTYRNISLLVLIAPSIANEVADLRPLALARSAWAYRTLQVQAPDLIRVLTKEALKKAPDFPLKALIKLVDSVYFSTHIEETAKLQAILADRIGDIANFFIKAFGSPGNPLRPTVQEYSDGIAAKQCVEAGIFGTPLLLEKLGIEMPSINWVRRWRAEQWQRNELNRVEGSRHGLGEGGWISHDPISQGIRKEVYTAAEVEVDILQETFSRWFVRSSEDKDYSPPHGLSCDPEVGLYVCVDQNASAGAAGKAAAADLTGLVLAEIFDEFCRRGVDPASLESCGAVTGSVRIVASSIPCLAVVGGLRQFLVTFPKVSLQFYEQAGTIDD